VSGFCSFACGKAKDVPLLVNPRAGVPAPPDSPANVPDAPDAPPQPSEPLEPGFPEEPERKPEDGDNESG
jgi:hypothetical protein